MSITGLLLNPHLSNDKICALTRQHFERQTQFLDEATAFLNQHGARMTTEQRLLYAQQVVQLFLLRG